MKEQVQQARQVLLTCLVLQVLPIVVQSWRLEVMIFEADSVDRGIQVQGQEETPWMWNLENPSYGNLNKNFLQLLTKIKEFFF